MATVELLSLSLSHNYTSPQLKRNLVKRKKKVQTHKEFIVNKDREHMGAISGSQQQQPVKN